jgi:hypothetical protein
MSRGVRPCSSEYCAVMQQRCFGIARQESRGKMIFDMLKALRIGDVVRLDKGLEQVLRDPGLLLVHIAPDHGLMIDRK